MVYGKVEISDEVGRYVTEVEINEDVSHKITSNIIETLNTEKPYYIRNGKCSYWSGSVTALFADNTTGECESDYDFTNASFKINCILWMHNGRTKTLKLSNDFILKVAIGNQIQIKTEKTIDEESSSISFEWNEIET